MLHELSLENVKRICELAKAARDVKDAMLRKVRDEDLGQPKPARGEHNPAGGLGLDPVPFDHPTRTALRDAIDGLSGDARRELLALVWIGRGDYGPAELDKAFTDAASITDLPVDRFTSDPDLHDLLMKSLYELKLT